MHEVCNEWEERLDGQSFHGGDRPDAADFRMFAEVSRVETLPIVIKIFASRKTGCGFIRWFKLM